MGKKFILPQFVCYAYHVPVLLLGPPMVGPSQGYRRICSSFSSFLFCFFFKSSFCNWLRAHAIFSDRPGVVALAGSLSCYRKSNILNYLIGNVAGKYLVRLIFTRAFFLRFPDHLINVFEVKCSFLDKLTHITHSQT